MAMIIRLRSIADLEILIWSREGSLRISGFSLNIKKRRLSLYIVTEWTKI